MAVKSAISDWKSHTEDCLWKSFFRFLWQQSFCPLPDRVQAAPRFLSDYPPPCIIHPLFCDTHDAAREFLPAFDTEEHHLSLLLWCLFFQSVPHHVPAKAADTCYTPVVWSVWFFHLLKAFLYQFVPLFFPSISSFSFPVIFFFVFSSIIAFYPEKCYNQI